MVVAKRNLMKKGQDVKLVILIAVVIVVMAFLAVIGIVRKII